MNRAAQQLMGSGLKRRTGSRVKSKKSSPRKAPSVKIKIKGTPAQVTKTMKKFVEGDHDDGGISGALARQG